jgi:hypothetical protein
MKTLRYSEAVEWSKARGIALDERGRPTRSAPDGMQKARVETPKEASKHFWLCRQIEHSLRPWTSCIPWVTEWGVWQSSENWHLYYRLRQSYGDHSLLADAPAHLFLEHETYDLFSFLQIGLAAGWDMSLLSDDGYGQVFVSHDEWIEFVMQDGAELERIQAELSKAEKS